MLVASTASAMGSVRPLEAAMPLSGAGFKNGDVVDERALLEALRAGQESAFETMVRVYGGRLLAVARRITRNDEDARDVVQSAYLSAFRALPDFEGNCQLS